MDYIRSVITDHKKFLIIISILMMVVIPLTVFQVQTQQQLKQHAAGITIGFDKPSYSVEINKNISINIIIANDDKDKKDISAVDFTLTYDKENLILNGFSPESTFEQIIKEDNQSTGTLRYVGAHPTFDTEKTTAAAVAVGALHFQAKNIISAPIVQFGTTQITISNQTESIDPTKQPATINIISTVVAPTATVAPVPSVSPISTPGNITLHLSINAQDVKLLEPTVSVNLVLSNFITRSPVNDAFPVSQTFSKAIFPGIQYAIDIANIPLAKLPPGKYYIFARKDNMIGQSSFTVGSSNDITVAPITLVLGDINTSHKIDISDSEALTACYKKSFVLIPSCALADLDKDNDVDQVDRNTLLRGFKKWREEEQIL